MEFENDYNQTDSESDDFLLDVPMSLIKENIKIQFDEPLDHSRKDHINQFISTYRSSKEHIDDYDSDDDDQDIIELRDDFYFNKLVIGRKKKRYISSIKLREGNLITPYKADVKGFDYSKLK